MFRPCDLTRVRIGFCGMDLATGPVPKTLRLRSSRSSLRDQPVPRVPIRLLRFPRSTPPPVPSARPLGFSVRSQRDSLGFNPQTINGSRSYPRRREVQSRRAVGSIAKFRKKDMRQAAARQAAAGQRRGAGGAETTGSLRAFSRGTPRMIALKEEAWYRALTLQTFRAFECVVPIMRDRVKNSPRPDRSRLPPRDSAFLLTSRWSGAPA